VKRKAYSAALLSVLLILALAGILLVNSATAGPIPPQDVYAPPPSPAIISVQSPFNKTYNVNSIPLNFRVTALRISKSDYPRVGTEITLITPVCEVFCYLDGQIIASTTMGTRSFSLILTDLPDGTHVVNVSVSCKNRETYVSLYDPWQNYAPVAWDTTYSAAVWSNSAIYFTVDTTPPHVFVLSPRHAQKYDNPNVPLDFTANESTSQLAYSLDGQENTTVAGNTTLIGLSEGTHNVTVYAWDNAGNVGASETITFSIAEPFPTTWIATLIVITAVVGVALLVYFVKVKKTTGKVEK